MYSMGNYLSPQNVASDWLFSAMLESSPDIIVFALDSSYCYLAFNQKHKKTMREIWGVEIELGMNMLYQVIGKPEDRRKAKEGFDRALAGESFVTTEEYGDEKLSRLYWQIYWSPIYSDKGEVMGLTCFSLDITESKRAEQELQEKKEQQEMLLDNIETQIWYRKDEKTYGSVNQSHADFFGVKKEELENKSLYELMSTREEAETCIAGNQEVFSKKQKIHSEEMVLNGKGESRLLSITKTPKLDANNNVEYVVCSAEDITDRKQAEKEREELSAEYETVFQSTQDAMFLIEVVDDKTFRFIRNNQAHAQATGLKTEDLRGKTPQDVLGEEIGTSIVENYKSCVQEKKPIKYEETLDLPGGKRIWSTLLTPVIEEEDVSYDVSYIVGSARDVTDHKQNEEALAMQNTLLKTQQEVSLDGILVVGADDRIISFNQRFADIWNIPDEIMVSQSSEKALKYVLPMLTDPEKFVERVNELYKNKQEKSYEEIFLKDGRVLERYSAPVIGDNNHYYGRVWYYRDITERKQVEERIRHISFHDSLTGLYNRAFLNEELKRLDTERQLPISIIMVDLNGLKLVNDVYGHESGDEMLKSAAEIINKSCRREDIVGRWGGDEFVILLPQSSGEEVEKIHKRIRDNCRGVNVKGVPVSLAVGSGTKDSSEKSLESALKEAEDSMYKQKLAEQKSVRGSVLNTLLKTLQAKSYETEEHTMRMVSMARKIGKKIGLADTELNRLNLVITLHDIGKINIPETTLTKEGSLTDEEWEIIKTHPEVGYRITRASEEFSHVSEDILAHHERWDGRGYPKGLKEKEIPLTVINQVVIISVI